MKVKLFKGFEKQVAKFNKDNLPIEGDEILAINCPICNKRYRNKGSEDELMPYNNPCKHIVLHLAPDFDEAIVDKNKLYETAFNMNEQCIDGATVNSIMLALYKQNYPNQIIKRYTAQRYCGHGCPEVESEFIVFAKET